MAAFYYAVNPWISSLEKLRSCSNLRNRKSIGKSAYKESMRSKLANMPPHLLKSSLFLKNAMITSET